LLSGHGTTVGKTKIEPLMPVFLELNTTICFGASTRRYTLRAKPKKGEQKGEKDGDEEEYYSSFHNLPEKQAEIDVSSHSHSYSITCSPYVSIFRT